MHFPKQLFDAPNKDFLIHRRKQTQITSKICTLFASLLLAPSFLAASLEEEVSSKNNERLRQALEKFPEADTDKDGVLTLIEARAFRAQQRGEEESQVSLGIHINVMAFARICFCSYARKTRSNYNSLQ